MTVNGFTLSLLCIGNLCEFTGLKETCLNLKSPFG